MNTNSEDEIFSILKPVETCLAEDDKARLWARIRQDSLRMRAFRRAAVIAVSAAAAIVAGVAIYFTGTWRSAEPQYISEAMPEAGGDIRIETSDKVIEVSSDATVSYHEGYFSVRDSVETKIHDIKKGGDVHQMIVPFGKTDYVKNLIGGRNIIVFICAFVGVNAICEMISATILTGVISVALKKARLILQEEK